MSRREIDAGPIESLGAEGVRVVCVGETTAEGRPREVLVLRDLGGRLRAYENLCKHLPVPLDGGTRELLAQDGCHLLCGTHGARYRLDDGYCVSGPCKGLGLDAHDVRVVEGRVVVSLRAASDDSPRREEKAPPKQ